MSKQEDSTVKIDVDCNGDDVVDFAYAFISAIFEHGNDYDGVERDLKELISIVRKDCEK